MLFERFEVPGLAHYSYAVGCPGAGAVAIVDPERDVDRYLDFAQRNGVRITHVLETHIHADYASGAYALGQRTGAPVFVSGHDVGETYETAFPHRDLMDGDVVDLGAVRLQARHTPGHTPEHLAFLVYDGARSSETPMLLLSGDFLFVGSLGRPDLLGEEQKLALARRLYQSTRTVLRDLPDGVEVHPAHGAGSMCGAGMSGRPSSTLGFERIANPYLDERLTEESFVERLLGSVPPFPPYYLRMKSLNAAGARPLATRPGAAAVDVETARAHVDAGHVVVDLRNQLAFGEGHLPAAIDVGLSPAFPIWAAWVVPPDTPVLLVADHSAHAVDAGWGLARVGLDDVVGHLDGGFDAWRGSGLPVHTTGLLTPAAVHARRAEDPSLRILDVRTDAEWSAGHIDGAIHVMAGLLPERLDALAPDAGPIAVICGSGYRSAIAASYLQRAGYEDVSDVIGGMGAWMRAGLPVVRGDAQPATSTA